MRALLTTWGCDPRLLINAPPELRVYALNAISTKKPRPVFTGRGFLQSVYLEAAANFSATAAQLTAFQNAAR
jgi:hypothetical protein